MYMYKCIRAAVACQAFFAGSGFHPVVHMRHGGPWGCWKSELNEARPAAVLAGDMRRVVVCLACLLTLLLAAEAAGGDREAARAFREGQRLERQGKLREALEAYTRAAEREKRDPRFVLHREMVRQRAAFQHVSAGLLLLRRRQYAEAAREFEQAHDLDPSNDFTRQELERAREAAKIAAGRQQAAPVAADELDLEPPLALRPRRVRRGWDLRGDARALYLAVGAVYGIQFQFDDGLPSAAVRFRLEQCDFSTAVRVLMVLTKTFVAPLEERVAIVTADTPQKRQEFERQVLLNLPVSELATPEEINELANTLRLILETRFLQPNLSRKIITVRDTGAKVQAVQRLARLLAAGRPEVLLEVEALEVHSRRSRELGLVPVLQSTLFKLSPLDGSAQSGVAVPLPQLFGRQPAGAAASSPPPLGVFGGGRSFFGLTIPGVEFRARLSESLVRGISTQTVRAMDNQTATFLVGERYPIVTVSFAPIIFSADIQRQQQQGTLINPFPAFTFEDLGIKLRITPRIHVNGEISLKVEAQVRSLSGQNFNGVPTISNRETDQVVRVRDGQATLISGMLSREERRSMAGSPGLSQIPVLNYLFGQRTREAAETEILVVVTPHILRAPPDPLISGAAVPVPTNYVPVLR